MENKPQPQIKREPPKTPRERELFNLILKTIKLRDKNRQTQIVNEIDQNSQPK
jgi:hypothetical protein